LKFELTTLKGKEITVSEHKRTPKTFEGKDFYVGIDVHKKQWTVTIRHQGLSLKTFSMDPSPEALKGHLERQYPGGRYQVAYEVGFCGFWIERRFRELGIDCIVVNAADIPTAHKEKDRKQDPVDSHKIARELEKGELRSIYIPSEEDQHLRSLCRLYHSVVGDVTRVKNRIKEHLYFNGVELPKHSSHWSGRFIAHLRSLSLDNGPARDCLLVWLEELEQHRKRLLQVLQKLRKYLRQPGREKVFRNLMSVPGVGFKIGMTLYAEIMDMRRFRSLDQLKSYAGLVPSTASSGEKERVRGMTYRRNRYVRYAIIEAAWVAIRNDGALLATYNKLIVRMKKQEAITRIAKKLLNRIRYVWIKDSPYVVGVVE
jgi:transposase